MWIKYKIKCSFPDAQNNELEVTDTYVRLPSDATI